MVVRPQFRWESGIKIEIQNRVGYLILSLITLKTNIMKHDPSYQFRVHATKYARHLVHKLSFIYHMPILLLLILWSCKSTNIPPTRNTTSAAVPVKAVFVKGDSLHYVEAGSGETVIFVHGTTGDYRAFGRQVDTFSKHYRVIVYSRRHTFPDPPTTFDSLHYTIQPHAEDLAAFIRMLNVGKVHLIGHSYGATTALQTAIDNPELVKSLVLGEPPLKMLLINTSGGQEVWNDFERNTIMPASNALKSGNPERALEIFIGGVMGDSTFYSRIPQQARASILKTNMAELKGALYTDDPFTPITCDDVAQIRQPVLLVVGDRSPKFFPVIIDELYRCLKNRERLVLANSSHGLQNENSIEFNRAVLSFLTKHK
jgi:pimeloyl-ACP methyl ester carboxylesterase